MDLVQFSEQTPLIKVYSLPLWIWRGFMLAWSLWFASKIFQWLKWGWIAIKVGGGWKTLFGESEMIEPETSTHHSSIDQ